MVVHMTQQPALSYGAPIHGSVNLPVSPPVNLLGRRADLDAIHVSLRAGSAVLLHGPAGIGKTALVATLATGFAELPGGVLWLECAGDTFRALLTRTARAYDLEIPAFDADLSETCQQVQIVLEENRPLVVLDGDVQLEAAREFVRECASGLPLLMTHTTILPGPWTPQDITLLNHDDTVELLKRHAGDALSEDVEPSERLLKVLNGHPLSIQVAARQLAMGTSADDLLAQVPNLPPGQKNLAIGVLMAAYRLMPPELQGIVMLLGTAFAARASEDLLCDVSGARPELLRDRMRQLVGYGFAVQHQSDGQTYFTVHELVQEFAQAFLRGKKRLKTMIARYEQGLPAYLRRHSGEYDDVHYSALAVEIPNVIGAGIYAAKQDKLDLLHEMIQVLDSTRVEGFVAALSFEPELDWLHYLAAHPDAANAGVMGVALEPEAEPEVSEVVSGSEAASETADVADEAEVVEQAETGETVDEDGDSADEATDAEDTALEVVTADTAMTAFPEETEPVEVEVPRAEVVDEEEPVSGEQSRVSILETQEQALKSYQADGNVEDELAALEELAKLNLEGENYEAVLSYLDRGTELAQEIDNPQREGEMLCILGDLQFDLGLFDGAEMAYMEAISALRPVEAWPDIGLTLEKLGAVYMNLHRVDEALGVWQQALPIFEKEADSGAMRRVLNRLGDVHSRRMEWGPAKMHYTRALEVAQATGEDRAQFVQISKLAFLMENSGNREGAIEAYWQALHLAFALDSDDLIGATELALARLLIDDTVHLNRALQLLEAAAERMPVDTEVQRLLSRAETRRERLMKADVALPEAEDSLQDYAQSVFDKLG